jgi:hypothetical protein
MINLPDFLARHFDRLVVQALGIDQHPELMPQYFGNYKRVIHLNQVRSEKLTSKARACAERLGLGFESHFTGLKILSRELGFECQRAVDMEQAS